MAKQAFSWYGYVYLLRCGEHYKIGFSKKPRKRVRQFRTGSPHPVELIHTLKTPHFKMIEQQLHYRFREKRVRGEWFNLDEADLEHILSLDSGGFTPEEREKRERMDAEYRASMLEAEAAERDRIARANPMLLVYLR